MTCEVPLIIFFFIYSGMIGNEAEKPKAEKNGNDDELLDHANARLFECSHRYCADRSSSSGLFSSPCEAFLRSESTH